MLKPVQHNINGQTLNLCCHPEPGPEPCPETSNVILNLVQDQGLTTSGSIDFGILFFYDRSRLEFLKLWPGRAGSFV